MLQMIIKKLLYKHISRLNYKEINKIRYEREVLPFYIITKNNFNYCIQNKLMKRGDILIVKAMLSEMVDNKYYQNRKFKNDAHEIYTKLANEYITQEQILKINDFIEYFLPEEFQV